MAALARKLLFEVVFSDFVPNVRENQTLLEIWSVDELLFPFFAGNALVEHIKCLFWRSIRQQRCHCVAFGLLRVVMGLGALMSTHLASSVMLYPLMPQIIQKGNPHRITEEIFRRISTLVDLVITTDCGSQKVPEQNCAAVGILRKR